MRLCIQCGADISTPELRQKVICPDCKKANIKEYKKKRRERIREEKGSRICVVCGKEFSRWGTTNVCSEKCRKARYEERNKIARRKYYLNTLRKRRGVSDTVACVVCQKEFPRNGQTKTCSPKCSKEHKKNVRIAYRKKLRKKAKIIS